METTQTPNADSSLKDLIGIVWRQKWVLAATLTVAVLAAVAFMLIIDPTFQSSVKVVVDGRASATTMFVNQKDPLGSIAPSSSDDVPTQIEQIQSRVVILQALSSVTAANPALNPKDPEEVQVTARQIGQTNGVEIVVTSPSGELSQQVAAQIPETYKSMVQDRSSTELRQGVNFVSSQLETEKDALAAVERDLDRFRKAKNISPSPSFAADLSAQNLQSDQRLSIAEGEASAAQDALNSALIARKNLPATIQSPTLDANITQIQLAKDRISQLEGRRLALLETYTSQAREVLEADAELSKAREYLKSLPQILNDQRKMRNPLIDPFEQQIEQAKSNLKSANARLFAARAYASTSKIRLDEYTKIVADISHQQQDIELKRASVQQLTTQLNQLRLYVNQIKNPVQVIQTPSDPVKNRPNPPLYLAIAIFVGSILAAAITLAKDRLEDRVSNLDQAFRVSGAPTLGYVAPKRPSKQVSSGTSIRSLPSRFDDSYRIIKSNILFELKGSEERVLLVTCTSAEDGSTDVALNIAEAFARSGKTTLLIDANLLAPSQHSNLGLTQSPGLADLLATDLNIDGVLQSTTTLGLSFLASGDSDLASADLLGSDRMAALFSNIAEKFDIVVVDSPPMTPRSDTVALTGIADAIIYVVKPGKTSKSMMRYCIELLSHTRARLLGLVFTDTVFSAE